MRNKSYDASSRLSVNVDPHNVGAAIHAYNMRREHIASNGKTPNNLELLAGDMRRFHLELRRVAKSLNTDERAAAYAAIVRVVEDMYTWNMRVGATEIAAHVFALQRLGRHERAIRTWRKCVDQNYGSSESEPDTQPMTRLFPQTHTYALDAAIALKNAHVVRGIYETAIHVIEKPQDSSAEDRLSVSRRRFFWAIFPAKPCESQNMVIQVGNGSGRTWDPARLGSVFLANVYKDACYWAGTDHKLLSRIMMYLIRALFTEGQRRRAVDLYISLIDARKTSNLIRPTVTREILCEVVVGLCRNAQLSEAYKLLTLALSEHRTLFAWNAYFDGLSNAIAKPQHGMAHVNAKQIALDRLRLAIREMKTRDGIEPDLVTRTIWLRACFRSGQWAVGVKWFRANFDIMQRDPVCWDTVVRGALASRDVAAQETGWRLIGDIVQRAESRVLGVDERMLETVLQCMLEHLANGDAEFVPDEALLRRILEWVEAKQPLARQPAFAITIKALLRANRIQSALDLHARMARGSMWPAKSVNCMIVAALANDNTSYATARDFIEHNLPRQHFVAAYFVLLKRTAHAKRYTHMWNIFDTHYPEICVMQTPTQPVYETPFPDAAMYNTVLRVTREYGDVHEHKRLLDRMQVHIGVVADSMPRAAQRIASVYGYYRNRQQDPPPC
ncbi:hypothetical protein GGH96_000422 [Coemansia sp. RSA 1972]|nr:hypothetical protein GGH96_000422 [Coemansia sp. RSA 1972]